MERLWLRLLFGAICAVFVPFWFITFPHMLQSSQPIQIIDPYTCTKIIHSKVMYVYLFNNDGQEIQHFRGRLIQHCGYKYTGSGFTDTFLLTSGTAYADEGYEYVEANWPLHFRASK